MFRYLQRRVWPAKQSCFHVGHLAAHAEREVEKCATFDVSCSSSLDGPTERDLGNSLVFYQSAEINCTNRTLERQLEYAAP